jgi:DNA transformation protein
MAASDSFAEFLREHLAPLGGLGLRRMFGATGVFSHGLMFALVAGDILYLRVDDGNRDAFAEALAEAPLSYVKGGKRIDLAYWPAPDRLMDAPEELRDWCRLALAAAARVSRGRAKPRPRR